MALKLQDDKEDYGLPCGGSLSQNRMAADNYAASDTNSPKGGPDCLLEVYNQFGVGISTVALIVAQVRHAIELLFLRRTVCLGDPGQVLCYFLSGVSQCSI